MVRLAEWSKASYVAMKAKCPWYNSGMAEILPRGFESHIWRENFLNFEITFRLFMTYLITIKIFRKERRHFTVP